MSFGDATHQLRELKEQFAKSEKLFNQLARFRRYVFE